MHILFDQGTPVPLRSLLSQHDVATAYERGWATLSNGALLDAAEAAGFDVLITTDQNLRYQQNLDDRRIAIVVLSSPSWPRIRAAVAIVREAVAETGVGTYLEVDIP